MASVLENRLLVSASFIDNNRLPADSSIYHVADDSFASVNDDVTALGAALIPLSTAQLMHYVVSRFATEDADEGAPPAESDVRRKLVLEFETGDRLVKPRMEIPSPVFTIETTGTTIIPVDNALVAAVAAVIANPLGTGAFVARGGEPILRLGRAWLDVRQRSGSAR